MVFVPLRGHLQRLILETANHQDGLLFNAATLFGRNCVLLLFYPLPHTLNTIFEQGIQIPYEQVCPMDREGEGSLALGPFFTLFPFSLGNSFHTENSNKRRVPCHLIRCLVLAQSGLLVFLPQEGFWDCDLLLFFPLISLFSKNFFCQCTGLSLHF